jgi:hypothetical protein
MAAPTFVSYTDTGWATVVSTASVATSSISVQSGDILVAVGATSDSAVTLAVSGGSLTWTAAQSVNVSNYCSAYIWTATASSTTSFAVTFSRTGGGGGQKYGGGVYVFRAASIGNSSKTNTTGAPSLALSSSQANSAFVQVVGDWNAADGASRTWRAINSTTPTSGNGYEKAYSRDSSQYTVYSAYWPDVGSTGSKTTGLSAPSGQQYAAIALEIEGTASAAASFGIPHRPLRIWRY